MIRDATRAFCLPCIEEAGFEADDIIASYPKAALAAGWHVTIVSSDKALMQLVEPGVDMLDTMKNARCGHEIVLEKFGVAPAYLGDEIGRAHVCTPVTTAPTVCRLLLVKKT